MPIPPVDLGLLVDRGRELCARVADAWEDQARSATGPVGLEGVATGLDHLFAMLQRLEDPAPPENGGRPTAAELLHSQCETVTWMIFRHSGPSTRA